MDANRGYICWSRSVRAAEAEADMRLPLMRGVVSVAEAAGVTRRQARAALLAVGPCEWHHTSKKFNRTDYYDCAAALRCLLSAVLRSGRPLTPDMEDMRGAVRDEFAARLFEQRDCSRPAPPHHQHGLTWDRRLARLGCGLVRLAGHQWLPPEWQPWRLAKGDRAGLRLMARACVHTIAAANLAPREPRRRHPSESLRRLRLAIHSRVRAQVGIVGDAAKRSEHLAQRVRRGELTIQQAALVAVKKAARPGTRKH